MAFGPYREITVTTPYGITPSYSNSHKFDPAASSTLLFGVELFSSSTNGTTAHAATEGFTETTLRHVGVNFTALGVVAGDEVVITDYGYVTPADVYTDAAVGAKKMTYDSATGKFTIYGYDIKTALSITSASQLEGKAFFVTSMNNGDATSTDTGAYTDDDHPATSVPGTVETFATLGYKINKVTLSPTMVNVSNVATSTYDVEIYVDAIGAGMDYNGELTACKFMDSVLSADEENGFYAKNFVVTAVGTETLTVSGDLVPGYTGTYADLTYKVYRSASSSPVNTTFEMFGYGDDGKWHSINSFEVDAQHLEDEEICSHTAYEWLYFQKTGGSTDAWVSVYSGGIPLLVTDKRGV